MSLPPFPAGYRASGLLLHVTSLPSPYGIGDLGPAAVAWVDRLHAAGQRWWQALPLGPTGYGDSPYQPLSSFAGNPLLISPAWLIEDELVTPGDCAGRSFPATTVDFDAIGRFKEGSLETAWKNFRGGARSDLRPAFEGFADDHAHWLDDYGLFRALGRLATPMPGTGTGPFSRRCSPSSDIATISAPSSVTGSSILETCS